MFGSNASKSAASLRAPKTPRNWSFSNDTSDNGAMVLVAITVSCCVCAQLLAAAWAALMSCLMQSAYRRNRFQIALNDKVDRQKSQAAHREPDAFAAYLLHAVGLLVFRRG